MDEVNPKSPRGQILKHRRFRACLLLSLCAALILVGVNQRALLGASFANLRSLTSTAFVLLVACWFTMVVSRGVVYRLTHRNFRFRHGIALDQVNLAAANGLPAGSVIGIAARIKMCRQLGHRSEQGALTVFASGQAFASGRWVCLVFVVVAAMTTRGIHSIDLVELSGAAVALSITALTWGVLTVDCRFSRVILEGCENLVTRTSRTNGAFRRARFRNATTRFRSGANDIVRERALKLVAAGALSTLFGAFLLVIVINDLSDQSIATIDILRAYLIARVATSFVPTPGAVGVLDGALTAGLVGIGVDPSIALSAVVVYRALTFVLPIAIGSLIYIGWYRNEPSEDSFTPDDDGSSSPRVHTGEFSDVPAAA